MRKSRTFRWSLCSPWVAGTHALRLIAETAIGLAAVAAMVWAPSTAHSPSSALASVQSSPDLAVARGPNLEAARLAASFELDMVAGLFSAALSGHTEIQARVRRGDTLRNVLTRAGIGPADFNPAILALRDVFDARHLRAGQRMRLFLNQPAEGAIRLVGFAFEPEVARTVHVARQSDGSYRARDFMVPLTSRIARAQGTITESLYVDAKRAGADDMVIAEISNLLAYTVDFQREIRQGDAFDIVFEQLVDPAGNIVKTGELHYVAFSPRGRDLAFWRYRPSGDNQDGFYDADGESARRFLMRTPVNGARLSSHFGNRRHPVLGYNRLHKGTDFAAPRGTPVYAAGNGVIERANRYGSFGNYIRIRHANGYKTAYAHLNGFARGIRPGRRVSQGQTIGYIGTTGRSTGPHLHYEVHRNGTPVNPMRIQGPSGRTLTGDDAAGFDVERARIDAMRENAADAATSPADMMMAAIAQHAAMALDEAARRDG